MAVDKHPNYWLVWAALAFLTFIEIFNNGNVDKCIAITIQKRTVNIIGPEIPGTGSMPEVFPGNEIVIIKGVMNSIVQKIGPGSIRTLPKKEWTLPYSGIFIHNKTDIIIFIAVESVSSTYQIFLSGGIEDQDRMA